MVCSVSNPPSSGCEELAGASAKAILVVDDQASIRQFVSTFLAGNGYHIIEAADASEGLHCAAEQHPDLIISDIMMPAMDGYEFVRRLRGHASTARIPVIFFTAVYQEEEQRALSVACGVSHFLTKPIEPRVLLETVHSALLTPPPDSPSSGSPAFEQDHLRLVTAKLRQQLTNLEQVNQTLSDMLAEKQQREDQLKNLSHRLLEVQENERRALAREVHDEFGQLLTALQFSLEAGMRAPARAVKAKLSDCQDLVRELLAGVRQLSVDLRPTMLDDLGLLPTLSWYCEQFWMRTGVSITFQYTGPTRRFAGPIESAAYRIVQEALTNVARHAQVSAAAVHLERDESTLTIRIEDQGAGFEPSTKLALHSSGLLGMRERATLLGGLLTIDAQPGRGTRLRASIPLR